MKQLSDFSRIPFGITPTPLYKLESLSREVGKNLYIKRDDMTGVALGGNKVRKLEYNNKISILNPPPESI